jgi:DNA-binding response OmpR family regulator
MTHDILLIADKSAQHTVLRGAFQALGYRVADASETAILVGDFPACPLMVLAQSSAQRRGVVHALCRARGASKLLVLTPFGADQAARELIALGVDDVLVAPVSTFRLEITLRNLLRLHALENARHTA